MAQERPKELFFVGEVDGQGRPVAFLNAIPARDLDAADIANLSDDELKLALASDLYQKTKPSTSREDAPEPKAAASTAGKAKEQAE